MRRIKEPTASNIRRPRYLGAQLLIIDELRFQALDRRDGHRLLQIVNHRSERSSTIITSNKSITEWPAMLAGDEALAAAILDCLLHGWRQLSAASYLTAAQASAQRRRGYKRRFRIKCDRLTCNRACGKVRVH
jgi:DNA replication protein DnaC